MTHIESKFDFRPEALRSKGTALRVAALLISLVGLILPTATSSAFGTSQSTSGFQIANWSILAPLAIGLALIMPGVAPRYGRLANIVAAVITATVLIYLSYAVFDAWRQLSEYTGQATDFMRGMAGNNSEMQTYANSYGQTLGVSVMPGVGLVAMLVATSLMAMLSYRIQQ